MEKQPSSHLRADIDRFSNELKRFQSQGRHWDIFDSIITQSQFLYIDPQNKYLITSRQHFQNLKQQLQNSQKQVQQLRKNIHKYQEQSLIKDRLVMQSKIQKDQIQKYHGEIIKQQQAINWNVYYVRELVQEELGKIQGIVGRQREKLRDKRERYRERERRERERDRQMWMISRYCQTQIDLVFQKVPDSIYFTTKKHVDVSIKPSTKCQKKCNIQIQKTIQALSCNITKLSQTLQLKIQRISQQKLCIQELQQKIEELSKIIASLQQENIKFRTVDLEVKRKIWQTHMGYLVDQVRREWEGVDEKGREQREQREQRGSGERERLAWRRMGREVDGGDAQIQKICRNNEQEENKETSKERNQEEKQETPQNKEDQPKYNQIRADIQQVEIPDHKSQDSKKADN